MYFHISFNTWLNYTKQQQAREEHNLKEEKRRVKCVKAKQAYFPREFEEIVEPKIDVSIEIEEIVYYTSEEEEKDASEYQAELGMI